MFGSDDFLPDDFDIETYFANEEKCDEIDQLMQLALDCNAEFQYAKAERFCQRAAELAELLNDVSRLIRARFWLATMQRMQGKRKEALGVFTWLIEVAYDPVLSCNLTEDDLWFVDGGFRNFVEVGRFLPEMRVVDLERVVDRGLAWLSSISRRNWEAGLRLQRGMLWKSQNRKEAALEEMEAALALRRRNVNGPGFMLEAHLWQTADLLQDLKKLGDATKYYQEVTQNCESNRDEQCRAWRGLGQVASKQENWAEAERCMLKALEIAGSIESPSPMCAAYNALGDVYLQQKQITQAINTKIQALHFVRQMEEPEAFYLIYRDFAEIRLHQLKQGNSQRFIPKVKRWLHRALPLAVRLDRQVNSSDRQTEIRALQAECEAVLAGKSIS
ncbi:MAG: tetratricopeptide repeat protein [Myxacorys chilensis ATA2-1-KO14]|jgi:tetratricopeptide (TPR) repeat protein|nr:tetratricopeptide repeat protein [Myxacorys chilensis ATA2-1-KO14]